MVILITGGSGFIGTNIALLARKKGYSVIVMDSFVRPKSEENIPVLKEAGVNILRGDVRLMQDFQRSPVPDAIIHLAANPGIPWSIQWPAYDFEVNAKGTINVLEYARVMGEQLKKKIPVIFASTNKVYSDLINVIPIKENDTRYYWDELVQLGAVGEHEAWDFGFTAMGINEKFPIDGFGKHGHSPYGASKLSADIYCQEYFLKYGVPTVVNRMSCIYGYYQKGVSDQGWIDHFIRQAVFEKKPKLTIFGNGKQVRDMLWGEDVADLYLREIENIDKVKGSVFNVGGGTGNTLSLIESIKIIEEITKKKFKLDFQDWRHADQRIYVSDIEKVNKLLGWAPTVKPLTGISLMIDKYTQN